jgi:hypothetical protein
MVALVETQISRHALTGQTAGHHKADELAISTNYIFTLCGGRMHLPSERQAPLGHAEARQCALA